ncbi:MAG: 4-hydroxy-tetrahydrodipicolinate synthase [Francisellaceae bacterium]|jgi:4-hydroxy-tetrahydrodipicolinate synthase
MHNLNNITVWTALITPMLNNGDIDYKSLTNCVRKQENAGNGILIVGSTGEGLALTQVEQREIVSYVMSLNLSVPVMAGVGGYQLQSQLEWLDFCETQSVDAYLLVEPIYAKPGLNGQVRWFETLMDRVNKPCMLYNVPSRTGSNLMPEVLTELKDHENLWALKEASGSLDTFMSYQRANPSIRIYSGEDGLISELASLGAYGVVSVVANVWPEATRAFMEHCLQDDHFCLIDQLTIQDIQLWKRASNALFVASNPIPAKAILAHKKWIESAELRPPLCAQDMVKLDELISVSQEITHWYELQHKFDITTQAA